VLLKCHAKIAAHFASHKLKKAIKVLLVFLMNRLFTINASFIYLTACFWGGMLPKPMALKLLVGIVLIQA
jgi:hypothetical protein